MKPNPTSPTISVRVQPRSACNSIAMQPDGTLKIRLTAPPVDGEANAALIDYLAECLRISKRSLQIVAGKASRKKVIRIHGIDPASLRARLSDFSRTG